MSRKSGFVVALPLILAACGGAPPPPAPIPPTNVTVTVTTTDAVNDGAPVVLRVYQLSSSNAFEAAPFYPLFEKDAATLQADMVKRDEFLLAPNTAKTLTLTPDDRVYSIGVFAAYHDPDAVIWHGVVDIPAHKKSIVRIVADKAGVTIKRAAVASTSGKPAK
jgi:type VI secretion system protein VasD